MNRAEFRSGFRKPASCVPIRVGGRAFAIPATTIFSTFSLVHCFE